MKFGDAIKIFPGFDLPTPFGTAHVPEMALPPLAMPKLDDEQKRAMAHALGSDLAMLPGEIPVVGDFLEDVLLKLHRGEIAKHLSPKEQEQLLESGKVGPDSIALLKIFLKRKGG